VPQNALGKLEITGEFDPAPFGAPVRASQFVEVRP
jgi:hypothetical protein